MNTYWTEPLSDNYITLTNNAKINRTNLYIVLLRSTSS